MSGQYDPPDKARLLASNPRIESIVELAVAAAEAQFPPKVKNDEGASRAEPSQDVTSMPKRGRKPLVTQERVQLIYEHQRKRGIRALVKCSAMPWDQPRACNRFGDDLPVLRRFHFAPSAALRSLCFGFQFAQMCKATQFNACLDAP